MKWFGTERDLTSNSTKAIAVSLVTQEDFVSIFLHVAYLFQHLPSTRQSVRVFHPFVFSNGPSMFYSLRSFLFYSDIKKKVNLRHVVFPVNTFTCYFLPASQLPDILFEGETIVLWCFRDAKLRFSLMCNGRNPRVSS